MERKKWLIAFTCFHLLSPAFTRHNWRSKNVPFLGIFYSTATRGSARPLRVPRCLVKEPIIQQGDLIPQQWEKYKLKCYLENCERLVQPGVLAQSQTPGRLALPNSFSIEHSSASAVQNQPPGAESNSDGRRGAFGLLVI
jgi:hypothetical protein